MIVSARIIIDRNNNKTRKHRDRVGILLTDNWRECHHVKWICNKTIDIIFIDVKWICNKTIEIKIILDRR